MTLFSPLDSLTHRIPPVAWRLGALALLLLAGGLDYLTGPEIAAAPFYIPILLVLALLEPWQISLTFACVAAAIFLGVDLLSDPSAAAAIYPYWRAFARLISFSLIAVTISILVGERRRLRHSERMLSEQADELAAKNRALNDTMRELQRLHLELVIKAKQAAVAEAMSAASYDMERPLVSIGVYTEEVSRLIRRLAPTTETVVILDEIRPLLEKLAERVGEMGIILQDIRSLRQHEAESSPPPGPASPG